MHTSCIYKEHRFQHCMTCCVNIFGASVRLTPLEYKFRSLDRASGNALREQGLVCVHAFTLVRKKS